MTAHCSRVMRMILNENPPSRDRVREMPGPMRLHTDVVFWGSFAISYVRPLTAGRSVSVSAPTSDRRSFLGQVAGVAAGLSVTGSPVAAAQESGADGWIQEVKGT